MQTTIEALNSSMLTPLKSEAQLERDFNRKVEAIMDFKNQPILKTAAELMAQTDPVVKYVWNHYAEQQQQTPISPSDVQHFWAKVSECAAELNNKKGGQ